MINVSALISARLGDPLAGALATLMIGSGVGHTLAPGYFRSLVPPCSQRRARWSL